MSGETGVRVSAANPEDAKDIARRRMQLSGYRVLAIGNVVDSSPNRPSAWRAFTVYVTVAPR